MRPGPLRRCGYRSRAEKSIRRLKDVAIVMDLHELAPVGWWAPGRRDGWWLERLAQVREDFPDRPRLAGRMSVATGGCKQSEGQEWFRTGKTD